MRGTSACWVAPMLLRFPHAGSLDAPSARTSTTPSLLGLASPPGSTATVVSIPPRPSPWPRAGSGTADVSGCRNHVVLDQAWLSPCLVDPTIMDAGSHADPGAGGASPRRRSRAPDDWRTISVQG